MSPTKTEVKQDSLWSVADAAKYLGVSMDWVYRRSASGELPCRKVGHKTRFLRSELEAWVSRQPGSPTDDKTLGR